MKKLFAIVLSLALLLSALTGCAPAKKDEEPKVKETKVEESKAAEPAQESEAPAEKETEKVEAEKSEGPVEIKFWTYPVGRFGDQAAVEGLIAKFNEKYPDIKVAVELIDYQNGDDKVNTAIEGGQAPDIIFEGPERLVANWGARGLMVDLSDLWTDEVKAAVFDSVEKACQNDKGVFYEYPICMTAHCMAVNRDLFEKADALQYLDEENHTWTTENYFKAIKALKEHGQDTVTAIFCSGQGGDQGTRALINNLYGGKFTNAEHTQYTANSPENIKALKALKEAEGVNFDPSINGGEEINLFNNGTLAIANCWNVSQEQGDNAAKHDFDVLPMAFPTDSGDPQLCGGIWGFGLFDNQDPARLDAAKKFVDFFANDETMALETVKTTTYWPVRDMGAVYEGDAVMTEYGKLTKWLGDYYQIVPGWAEARTAWWNMLQAIGAGQDIEEQVKIFDETANAAAAK